MVFVKQMDTSGRTETGADTCADLEVKMHKFFNRKTQMQFLHFFLHSSVVAGMCPAIIIVAANSYYMNISLPEAITVF